MMNAFELANILGGVQVGAGESKFFKGIAAAAATTGYLLGFHTDTTTGIAAEAVWATGAVLVKYGSTPKVYQNTGVGYGTAPTWTQISA